MGVTAFLQPQDVLGRRLDQLGSIQSFNLADIFTFHPIFKCGDSQFPATDIKKTVIAFVAFQNFSGPIAGNFTFGSSPAGTDWGSASPFAQPQCFPIAQPNAVLGAGGYSPGTVFGAIVTFPFDLVGTVDIVVYGWSE